MKLLILGGYGVFGGRLAELLSDCGQLTLMIAGRTERKAVAFCERYKGAATVIPLGLDRVDIAKALAVHKPDIVIDASGPFQDYGDDPYIVPRACIAAKVDYMDFADAADFVFGISELDDDAKAAGVTVLSGVSSFPVLTAAVLRKLGEDMTITNVKGGIAPSPYAGIGLNVMKAVVGYAGGPVKLIRNGKPYEAKGLAESLRYTIAPPGYLPLRNLHFSLVDVPDLQVLPATYPEIDNIWMGAGPVPEILHKTLNLLAKARAIFRLPSWEPFAPLFFKILNLMKFGEHRGGMFVQAQGIKKGGLRDGKSITKSWHLLAEGEDGPYIPSMAIEGLVRKWLRGERPDIGARPATEALELEDYDALIKEREIYTGFRDDTHRGVFKTILGDQYESLPPKVQALHGDGQMTWRGNANVQSGRNPLAKLIARIVGLNVKAGENIPLTVTFKTDENGEQWTRNFGGQTFKSHFSVGTGRNTHLAVERFGIVKIGLALVIERGKDGDKLRFIPRRCTVLGIPLPKFLLPREESFEAERDGKFHFNVAVKIPIVGLIAAYEGWLEPEKETTKLENVA